MPENTDDPALFRAQLRKSQLRARATIAPSPHARHSQAICTHLERWLECWRSEHWPGQPDQHSLGFCLPFRDECAILPLAHTLHSHHWQLSVPVVEQPAAPMVFRHWSPQAPLSEDRHGIAIPATAPCPPPNVLLLPVVAVDSAGYRLGYGGGYFDRTLARLRAQRNRAEAPWCIGVGFALARVASIHAQAHDQPLDGFVCEEGLQAFSERFTQTMR